MIFRGGRPLVCVGRPKRGFHIGYRRRGGGAYISFERGFSKIDERAGCRHARELDVSRCRISYSWSLAWRRGTGEQWIEGEKNMEKSSIAGAGTRRVAKNPRSANTMRHATPFAHADGSFAISLFRSKRHMVRECTIHRKRRTSRLHVKHCTRSVYLY